MDLIDCSRNNPVCCAFARDPLSVLGQPQRTKRRKREALIRCMVLVTPADMLD